MSDARKVITHYDPKPIPVREFDWSAVFDGYDGGDIDEVTPSRDPIGYGRTEREAIDDLMEKAA